MWCLHQINIFNIFPIHFNMQFQIHHVTQTVRFIRYDNVTILTHTQNWTGSQLSLLHVARNKKLMKKTKTKNIGHTVLEKVWKSVRGSSAVNTLVFSYCRQRLDYYNNTFKNHHNKPNVQWSVYTTIHSCFNHQVQQQLSETKSRPGIGNSLLITSSRLVRLPESVFLICSLCRIDAGFSDLNRKQCSRQINQ